MVGEDANTFPLGGEKPPVEREGRQLKTLPITWSIFPMRDSLFKAALFWGVVLFTLWAIWWNIQNLLFTIICGIILLASLSIYFLPTRFLIGEEGVKVWRWKFPLRDLTWSQVRTVEISPGGLFISLRRKSSPLYRLRGFFIPIPDPSRPMIDELLKLFPPSCQVVFRESKES